MVQTKNDTNAASPPSRNTPDSKVVKLSANATNMYTKHMYYSFSIWEGKLVRRTLILLPRGAAEKPA